MPIGRRVIRLYALLIALNVGVWVWAALALDGRPLLLGTAALAYGFGLRHAVDADHIAAIDNVTRKLMGEGRQPLWTGFFFAMGHSGVVLLLTAAVAATAGLLEGRLSALRAAGDVVGTLVSSVFLFAVAGMNLMILRDVWRCRQGREAAAGGLLTRLFRPAFRLVTASWHMLPVGFLFGLGFDTATEVSLLGMSAAEASHGLALSSVLVFPALFACGMSLIDVTDGVMMVGAYRWALARPGRRLTYNLAITLASVAVAVVIGGVEALGLLADRFGFAGTVWRAIGLLNDHFTALGVGAVVLFAVCWGLAALLARRAGEAA